MTQKLLHLADIGSARQQMGGEGVAEGVWTDGFLEPRLLGQLLDDVEHRDARHPFLEVGADEEVVFVPRLDVDLGAVGHIVHNLGYGPFGDGYQALLAALALDLDEALAQVEVGELEVACLGHAQTAAQRGIPILLDAVGIACSKLRRDYVCEMLKTVMPTVIKGNYSEINALYHETYRSSGVDADAALDARALDEVAVALSRTYHTVILASGKVDIVTDGRKLIHVKNGTPQLSGITGTGCMLGALAAAYLSVQPDLSAAVTACVVLGACGQLAETDRGSGSFMVGLMDALSAGTDGEMEQLMDVEEIEIEGL